MTICLFAVNISSHGNATPPGLLQMTPIVLCAKVRVLVKEPKGRDVNDDDKFHFNAEFWDAHIRIKINTIQMKETEEENKKVTDMVSQVSLPSCADHATLGISLNPPSLLRTYYIANAVQRRLYSCCP